MSSVGEILRRERLRTGLDLERIAQDTKISVRTLELIEENQFEKLPGGVFARSFVRQYAQSIGLDEEEIRGELDKALAPVYDPPPTIQESASQPELRLQRVTRWGGTGSSRPDSNSSLPALGLVVVVIVACSAAYTWWQKSGRAQNPAERVERAQAERVADAPAPAPEPSLDSARSAAADAPATSAQPSTAMETRAPDPPATKVSGTVTADDATGALRIALTAEEPTWVRATAHGKVVFSGIIQAKETKDLSAPDTVTLRIGNAGAIAISLNGKAIPSVGPRGQVRVVQLSPDGAVQVVTAPPKPQPVPPPTPLQHTHTL